jgi:erythromycin esterase
MMKPTRIVTVLWITILALCTTSLSAQNLQQLLAEQANPFEQAEDLTGLLQELSGERLILMGEASHGTSQYYTKRALLSKKLIQEKGLNFIAVEGDWASMARINEYVKHKPNAPGSLESAMESIDRWPLWMWRNLEFQSLVEWLHDYNRNLPMDERVGLYGIDVYNNRAAKQDVISWIERLDPDLAVRAERSYSCKTRFSDTGDYIRMVGQTGDDCSEDMENVLEWVRSLENHPDANRWDYFRAEHGAKVAINAEKHYRGNLYRDGSSWNDRARHFYLTAQRLLEYYDETSRGAVWAHNTHIGDARATDMRRAGMVNIGQLSREDLGAEQVFAIGFGTYNGHVIAAYNWEGEMQEMQIPNAQDGSWESILEQTGHEKLWVTFSETNLTQALSRPLPHRAIGVTYNPANESGNYVQTVIPDRYNAFIFIKTTTTLTPLDSAQ